MVPPDTVIVLALAVPVPDGVQAVLDPATKAQLNK
jgi:hypothetical protein